jgi:hypothetical protein
MWNYHKKHYNPKHSLEGVNGDPNKAKKNTTLSVVKKA